MSMNSILDTIAEAYWYSYSVARKHKNSAGCEHEMVGRRLNPQAPLFVSKVTLMPLERHKFSKAT